jgi:hypothetical protein
MDRRRHHPQVIRAKELARAARLDPYARIERQRLAVFGASLLSLRRARCFRNAWKTVVLLHPERVVILERRPSPN